MRHIQTSSGFTLVEVLVISPIIILFIGSFIALLVNLTGESLVTRERNVAIYDSQTALDDIKADVSQATGFLTSTGPLTSPQGKNDSGTAFTDTNSSAADTLIIKKAATSKTTNDSSREPIYLGAGSCDSRNPIYSYYVVYFVADDPETTDTADRALFKRTILPAQVACATPVQKGSCKAAGSGVCQTRDERLVGGIPDTVAGFDVKYYSNGVGPTETGAGTATDVSVSMSVAKQAAGNSINYGSEARTSSSNIQPVSGRTLDSGTPGTPGAPVAPIYAPVTWTRNNTGSEPYKTTFSWAKVGNATGYIARYAYNGAAPTEQAVGLSDTPNFGFTLPHRKSGIDYFEVKVVTPNGTVSYGTPTTLPPSIPNWNECTFSGQGAWNNYGTYYSSNTFTTAGFTKTSSKIVGLKGLVKGTTLNVPICTLPVGFRPKFAGEKLIFQVASANGSNWGRIDVFANGDVVPVQGNTEWFSLDGIMFLADDSTNTWTVPSGGNQGWQSSWSNYGPGHATLRQTVDSQGRRHVQGLGAYNGAAPNGYSMTNTGFGSSATLHYPAMSGGPGIVQILTNGQVVTRSSAASYQSLQLIYRPSGATGWQNMPFSSGWTNYNNGFPTMQCHKGVDDVVIVQGLIAHPSDGNGAYIGDTGPCGRFSSGEGIGVKDRLLLSPWTSNEAPGRIDMVNGVSLLSQGTASGWTSLDGIHFIAD